MGKAVITVMGRKKLCKAHAGDIALPAIVKMAFGDGGMDDDAVRMPTGEERSLYHEIVQKNVDAKEYGEGTEETTCRYSARLGEGECTGEQISEIGLIDSDGDLVAIRTFLPMGKTEDIALVFSMDEIF